MALRGKRTDPEALMNWIGPTLLVVLVILPLALLCYSGVSTGLEIWRKTQPFADSFFDALYSFMFRHPKSDKSSGKSKLN